MKDLKEEMKELQKEMKELRNNPNKLAKINTRFMETNMKYMSHSWKPTFYTLIPMLLIFGWLNSNFGYYPLTPNSRFSVTAQFEKGTEGIAALYVSNPEVIKLESSPLQKITQGEAIWDLTGVIEGEYILGIVYKNTTYSHNITITTERRYSPVEKDFRKRIFFFSSPNENGLNKIVIGNKKVIPFENVALLKDIPWLNSWSWLGVYIFFSLIFSMLFRKIFNIY